MQFDRVKAPRAHAKSAASLQLIRQNANLGTPLSPGHRCGVHHAAGTARTLGRKLKKGRSNKHPISFHCEALCILAAARSLCQDLLLPRRRLSARKGTSGEEWRTAGPVPKQVTI